MVSPYKRMTLRVEAVVPGKLRGQRIVQAKGGRVKVEFDLVGDLIEVAGGDKLSIEFYTEKPESMDKYVFCGQGYLASSPGDPYTVFSVWGLIFRFEPSIALDPNTKYYICMKRDRVS